jgi:hypothetical protein
VQQLVELLPQIVQPVGVAERIAQPVQRLDDAHRRPPGPVELARSGRLERDHIAELDRAQPRVGMDHDLRRHGIGEAEVVGGSHAVDQHPDLVAARDRVDHLPKQDVRSWCRGV